MAILRPVVAQMRHEVMVAHAADLAGVAAGQGRRAEDATLGGHARQMLLVAHGDEQGALAGRGDIDHPAMRSPMHDAAFGTAEDPSELPVGPVMQDVIAAVAIEHEELAIGPMQSPRRPVLVLLGVLAGVLGNDHSRRIVPSRVVLKT